MIYKNLSQDKQKSKDKSKLALEPRNFVIVAHPDDETIFFSSLMLQHRARPWSVVCVTDANADGHGQARYRQWLAACRELGAHDCYWLNYPDIFEKRLQVDTLMHELRQLVQSTLSARTSINSIDIFTHNPLGEYGHPHHQDVCAAVHRAFPDSKRIWSVAYNARPEKTFRLSAQQYALKTKILSRIYFEETKRFSHFLPAHSADGFLRLSLQEVESIYRYLLTGGQTQLKNLKHYAWYIPYLKAKVAEEKNPQRPF